MRHKNFTAISTLGATLAASATIVAVIASQHGLAVNQPAQAPCEDPVAVSVLVVEAKRPTYTIETPALENQRYPVLQELPEIQEEAKAYTEAELDAMALVIYQEAGGNACSDETRIMVGNVVMNRVADSRFPNTIEEVLLQKAQYGRLHWTGLVWPERAANEPEAVERAYKCAEMVLNGEKLLPDDCIWQAEFIQGKEVVAHTDGFYFCR